MESISLDIDSPSPPGIWAKSDLNPEFVLSEDSLRALLTALERSVSEASER